MSIRLGLPLEMLLGMDVTDDDLIKARSGFTRGGAHKYVRRVRTMQGGKLAWKYYYANDKERTKAKAKVHARAHDKQTPPPEAALMSEFQADHPNMVTGESPLSDLTPENVALTLTWQNPPEVSFSNEVVEADYHKQLVPMAESPDPHDGPISPLRASEIAFERMPPRIKRYFSGAVDHLTFSAVEDDPYLKRKKNVAGYARPRPAQNTTDIAIAIERTFRDHGSAHQMNGGLFPVECIVHEMGHAMHNRLGAVHPFTQRPEEGYDGPVWEDFKKFYNGPGKGETAITKYAETNIKERWAESFTAAILYPQQLAETAPLMYEFMRKFMGEDYLPPLHTNHDTVVKLQAKLDAEKKRKPPSTAVINDLAAAIDAETGILDMPETHPRVAWWTQKKETRIQTLIRTAGRPNYATDSVTGTFHSDDKFYEMNVGGRTVFIRVGPRLNPRTHDWDDPQWTPTGSKGRLLAGNIKEVYDSEGNALDRKVAWWYLHQDAIRDKQVIEGDDLNQLMGRNSALDMADLVSLGEDLSTTNTALRNTFNLHEVLGKVARDKSKNLAGRPVEIDAADFRRRSGAFAYTNWVTPGEDLIGTSSPWRAALADLVPGTPAYKKHWAEYTSRQPSVAFEPLVATQWHVNEGRAKRVGQLMGRRYLTDGGVPRLTQKRFVNVNPDGSHTVIETSAGEDGRFYINNPIWRKLLTPNGGDVKSPEHLRHLCQQAMEAGLGDPPRPRRAWVSVRADHKGAQGDTEHYMHMQVEFDGRGQPRVLGQEWRHLTGEAEPRLDDLLTPARKTGDEVRRARMLAEKIKHKKAPRARRGKALLPQNIGDRVILEVTTDELGLKTAGPPRGVIARVARIIPGSKAGEKPSPPGWDRMPEGFDRPYPAINPEALVRDLSKWESNLVDRGILPMTYGARLVERAWVKDMLVPAMDKYSRTLKRQTELEIPAKYMFVGESSGGAGRKHFIRTGVQDVIDTVSYPPEEPAPGALEKTPLLYVHKTLDPRTGELEGLELRMLMPTDGHIDSDQVERLPGINVIRGGEIAPGVPGGVLHITLDMAGIPRLRKALGGMSLTSEAEEMMRRHADEMRDLEERTADAEHVMDIEDIDPLKLSQMGVGLKSHMSDGTRFVLAHHQAALVQKLLDNHGRVLGAHFMGTGKTISALVAAKLMMARSNPDSPMYDPDAPTKTLIVAPLNVVEQWRQAAIEFDEGATVVGAKSSDIPVKQYLKMVADGTDKNDLVVVGPEYFTAHADELKEAGFDALVVDEAHMGIKNAKTQRNKAIASWNPDMKMMMLLTGTPITTSPSDILEYIKILSNGQQWVGMTQKMLEEQYLEESPVPGEIGVRGKKGPKVQIKASKRDELAAILAKWVHVAMAKDVRGKTLPAVRMEESKHAEMIGIQAQLYAMQLASLPHAAREGLKSNAALATDEMRGLGTESRRRVQAAKSIANCPAFKPASTEKVLMYNEVVTIDEDGTVHEDRVMFRPFGKGYLKNRTDIRNKRLRRRMKGRWPPADEMSAEIMAIYDLHFKHVIDPNNEGLTYAQVAGQKVTKAQYAAMDKRHRVGDQVYEPWGNSDSKTGGPTVANPDAGPLGIRCRGQSTRRPMTPREVELVDRAQEFRRTYQANLTSPVPGSKKPPLQADAWAQAKAEMGIDEEEAQYLLGVPPEYYNYSPSITHGGVTVTTADEWVSDTRGSLHLLYRTEDWDFDAKKPRSAGGFDATRDLDRVEISGKYAWLKKPRRADDTWEPPIVRYREDQGELTGQRVAIEVMSGPEVGAIKWVRKSEMSALVPSLMDPGRRSERDKADVAMVIGNAKAEELAAHIENFHVHTGNGNFAGGEDRSRSMVIFANGILDGCRTIEATLRVQGFRDVNEVLEGSPHYDPADGGPAPNGKYFVTYIGATYTGDRELNIEISKKLKDKLGRDTDTSLFVHKTENGRKWKLWPGQPAHKQIKMSQWTTEQRERIYNQFKIRAPEAHFTSDRGAEKFFYGTTEPITIPGEVVTSKSGKTKPMTVKGSAGLLREMVLTGDPSKMVRGSSERKAAEARLTKLGDMYEALVRDHAVTDDPMTKRQINVMNNTEIMVLSDAAQVGINKGDAVELVMYDSLASPMAEMQRITRSARMLPPAVRDEMMNKYITAVSGLKGGDFSYAQLQTANADLPAYAKDAVRIDHLWNEMQRTGQRPDAMEWLDYKARADKNGAKPGTEEQFKARSPMNADAFRDADRITYEVGGKVAVAYTPRGSEEETIVYVSRSKITETDGPFRRIRDKMESGAFDPKPVGHTSPGQVHEAQVFGGAPEALTFNDTLRIIAKTADEAMDSTKSKEQKAEWQAISARARTAATLGVVQARTALDEFRSTQIPGQTGNVLSFTRLEYVEPTAGTYGLRTAAERAAGVESTALEQSIAEPINAIRDILENEMSEGERIKVAKAGFVSQGESGGIDATEIYLAMRAQEIMANIAEARPNVGRRMRAQTGGKIVTESDITNTIIDEMSPMDRAILKSKKYLVNVRRIGASGFVPVTVPTMKQRIDNDGNPMFDKKGKPLTDKTHTFSGFEKQYPIATERNTRAIGRARVIPVEDLLFAIQQGVHVRTDMDFDEAASRDVADMSRLDPIKKAGEDAERIVGGRADHRPDSDFNAKDLATGTSHEMEHTDDRATAREIAKDHLAEDPDYYRKLARMEKSQIGLPSSMFRSK